MEALGSILSGFFVLGCFTLLPLSLAILAIADVLRSGGAWYWIPIVLFFPLVGPLVYFLAVRSPWGRQIGAVSPFALRRQHAGRRLRELQMQLAHWRGPGVLAEAGEHQLTLRRFREAEATLSEALRAGAEGPDVRLHLVQALAAQRRWGDAVPHLEAVIAEAPPFRLADAWLVLGRCLDEAGVGDRAQAALREHLRLGSSIEAKVRLARRRLQGGDPHEAAVLLEQVRSEAAGLPRYLRREHGAWIRAARRLRTGGERLPPVWDPGRSLLRARRVWLAVAAVAVLAGLGAATVVGWFLWQIREADSGAVAQHEESQRIGEALAQLAAAHPWPHPGESLASVDLTGAELDRYLRVRHLLAPSLREAAEERQQVEETMRASAARISEGGGVLWALLQGADAFPVGSWLEAETRFRGEVLAALESERMGPDTLGNLAALVEWRFLGRDELLLLGLPDFYRVDYLQTRSALESTVQAMEQVGAEDPDWRSEMEESQEQSTAKLADLEARARQSTELSPATLALLEEHRAELEALPVDGLSFLLQAADPELPWMQPFAEE